MDKKEEVENPVLVLLGLGSALLAILLLLMVVPGVAGVLMLFVISCYFIPIPDD